MLYFLLPDGNCIARIPRVCSRSIAKAIVTKYYHHPEGQDEDAAWLSRAPQSETPQGKIYALVRDPVDRFLSTCALIGLTVEDGLLSDHEYFRPQSDYTVAAEIYKLPEFCQATGLSLPHLGQSDSKPYPTPEQRSLIEARFASDIAMFNLLGELS